MTTKLSFSGGSTAPHKHFFRICMVGTYIYQFRCEHCGRVRTVDKFALRRTISGKGVRKWYELFSGIVADDFKKLTAS